MIRNFDTTGRITIPKEIRKKLKLANNEPMRIELVGDMIILTSDRKETKITEKKEKIIMNYIHSKKV